MNNMENQFIQSIHDLTGIPLSKMKRYTEEFENPLNIIDHYQVLLLTDKQRNRLDALKSLISGFNHLKKLQSLNNIVINSTADARNVLAGMLSHHRDREYFVALLLNNRNEVIENYVVKGDLSACYVNRRDVLAKALYHDAASIIFGHNHPANHPEPSKADLILTQSFVDIFKPLEIAVLDHIIVTELETFSMAEFRSIDFNYVKGEADYSTINISENQWNYSIGCNQMELER